MNNQIFGDLNSFFKKLLNKLDKLNIDLKNYPIDHFCYRTSSVDEYKNMKKKMQKISSSYVENIHNGRPISKYILKEPVNFGKYRIDVLELPSPKSDKNYQSGLQHFEFVVENDFEEFKEKYKSLWSGIESRDNYNEAVYVTFENDQVVKFHEFPLLKILKLQGQRFTNL